MIILEHIQVLTERALNLGGSLKNVIALAAGIADGLGYGDNTEAALMTRGIKEITQLGVANGWSFKNVPWSFWNR